MVDLPTITDALDAVARRWRDPEHPARAEAVQQTLEADNRFTEEAIAFAVNQQMDQLTAERLGTWIGSRRAEEPLDIGVLAAGNVPLADLQDFLAVVCVGHRYIGVSSSKSPFLLQAFVHEAITELPSLPAAFASYEEMLHEADGVIATGSDETVARVSTDLDEAGIASVRRLMRGHRFSVAVVDGRESDDEREALAEDALLHEGLGCRNVAIIWAPEGNSPDKYLDAFAHFRAVFPAHQRTPGSLKMHQAMLAAVDVPHAYGEGLEFLISKGAAEVQAPGHIRWAEYHDLSQVSTWIRSRADQIQLVVARSQLASRLSIPGVEIVPPGEAQRPALDWRPDGTDTVDFLVSLRTDSTA